MKRGSETDCGRTEACIWLAHRMKWSPVSPLLDTVESTQSAALHAIPSGLTLTEFY